jgi:hypothetical protein
MRDAENENSAALAAAGSVYGCMDGSGQINLSILLREVNLTRMALT